MPLEIRKASITTTKARVALAGPSGAGKTWNALGIARGLVGPDGKILVIDTENGSASKYAPYFDFDVLELTEFPPARYLEAMRLAEHHKYDVVIIDSLSHAWSGKGGVLEMQGNAAKKTSNSFTSWREVTPEHNSLVDAIIRAPYHVVCTMRVKTAYETNKDDRGKIEVLKVGLEPIQRAGFEYEFDLVIDVDLQHAAMVSKTRFPDLDEKVYRKPKLEIGETLAQILSGLQSKPLQTLQIAPGSPQSSSSIDTSVNTTDDGAASPGDSGNDSGGYRDRLEKATKKGFHAVTELLPEIQALTPVPRQLATMEYYHAAISETVERAIEQCARLSDLEALRPYLAALPVTVHINGEDKETGRTRIFAAAKARHAELAELEANFAGV